MDNATLQSENPMAIQSIHKQWEVLANCMEMAAWRYTHTGTLEDLREAVLYGDIAISALPTNHPDKGALLNNQGTLLAWKYERFGALDDLQHAVLRTQEALDITPHGHPNQAGRFNNLSNWLGRLFERTGSIDALQTAISLSIQAVELTPYGHPCLASRLHSLGIWLARKYEQSGNLNDFERAIKMIEYTLSMTQCNHPNSATYLSSCGSLWALRYRKTSNGEDLLRALAMVKLALDSENIGSVDKMAWLRNLDTFHTWKYEITGTLDDLQAAVFHVKEALRATPSERPNRVVSLEHLGYCMYIQGQKVGAYRHPKANHCMGFLSYDKESLCWKNAPLVAPDGATYKAASIIIVLERLGKPNCTFHQERDLCPTTTPCSGRGEHQSMLVAYISLVRGSERMETYSLFGYPKPANGPLLSFNSMMRKIRNCSTGKSLISRPWEEFMNSMTAYQLIGILHIIRYFVGATSDPYKTP